MTVPDPIDIVSEYLTSLGNHDLDQLASLLAEDSEAFDVPLGVVLRGRDAIVEALADRMRAFPDASIDVRRVASAGEWVATEHVSGGTHDGLLVTPAGEISATGRRIETEMSEWFRVENGLITVSRAYWDVATAMRQLGVGE